MPVFINTCRVLFDYIEYWYPFHDIHPSTRYQKWSCDSSNLHWQKHLLPPRRDPQVSSRRSWRHVRRCNSRANSSTATCGCDPWQSVRGAEMMWATQRTRIRYGGKNPNINTHINSLELVHVDVKVGHDAVKGLQSLGSFLHKIVARAHGFMVHRARRHIYPNRQKQKSRP